MRRPSVLAAGVDFVVFVMTSLTFDTTEVFILSANSAVAPSAALVRAPVSPALTAGCSAVVFIPDCGAGGALCALLARAFGAALTAVLALLEVAALTAAFGAGAGLAAVFGAALSAGFGAAFTAGFGAGFFDAAAGAVLSANALVGAALAVLMAGLADAAFTAAGAALVAVLAAGRAAALAAAFGVAAGRAFDAGASAPAIFLASAAATVLTTPGLRVGAAAAALPDFLTDFVTVSFILPSRCLPLAALACWQFSRQTKAMHENRASHIKPCRHAWPRKTVHYKTGTVYTKHCSKPRIKTSFGKFLPINTILLPRSSFSAHFAPRSLPIIWCTPWKTTLRSAPSISSTPL